MPRKTTPEGSPVASGAPDCALMVYGVPRELKNQFAAQCRVHDKTLKEGIIALLRMGANGTVNPFNQVKGA